MAQVSRIEGVDRLLAKLRAREAAARKDRDKQVVVGYTASYAIFVHENLEVRHPTGQAKFLEQPLRELRSELIDMVKQAVRKGATLVQGLLMAGLRLQRESQQLCPVDTGALRASAFTRIDS